MRNIPLGFMNGITSPTPTPTPTVTPTPTPTPTPLPIYAFMNYVFQNLNTSSTHTFNSTEIYFSWSGATITGQSPTYTITNVPGDLSSEFTTPNILLPSEFLNDSNVRFYLHRKLCSSRTNGSAGRGLQAYAAVNFFQTYGWNQSSGNSMPNCASPAEFNTSLFLIDDLILRPYLLPGDVIKILAIESYINA